MERVSGLPCHTRQGFRSVCYAGDVLMPSVKGFRVAYIKYSRAFDAFRQGLPIRFGRATRASVAVVVVWVLIESETGA